MKKDKSVHSYLSDRQTQEFLERLYKLKRQIYVLILLNRLLLFLYLLLV